ncbi:MAG: ABC transporter ATP-binding protein [Clostridia bacterium]|nr:ABC transporter ATP-binding protein [Clostridia bacterium]
MLEIHGLTRWYGRTPGINGIDIAVEPGSVCAVCGAPGSGKSTLVRAVMGIIRRDAGIAAIDGEPFGRSDVYARMKVGCMTDNTLLPPEMSVRDVIDHAGLFYEEGSSNGTGTLIRRLKIDLRRKCRELTPVERKKVWLVMAIMHIPAYLILDEPTAGFDAMERELVLDILRAEKDRGAGILFTTESISDARSIGDMGVFLDEGSVVIADEMQNLMTGEISLVTLECDDGGIAARLGGKGIRREGDTVRFLYEGTPDNLVKELSGISVRRLFIEEAPVAEIIEYYYR